MGSKTFRQGRIENRFATFSWELEKKITRKQTFIRTNLTNEERSQQFIVSNNFNSVGQ